MTEREFGLLVCEEYGGDPNDPVWWTARGIAGVVETLSSGMRAYAACWASAAVAADLAVEFIQGRADDKALVLENLRLVLKNYQSQDTNCEGQSVERGA